MRDSPILTGFGLGFRPQQAKDVMTDAAAKRVDWFEVVSENFFGVGGRPARVLENLRARYPIVMHGVGMSIASTDPLNERYLKALKQMADICDPQLISDHLCWTNHRHKNSHDLLPVAYNLDSLQHVAARVHAVQEFLGRRIVLENPSAYVQFAVSDWSEADYLAELSRRTGCGILLDINNLFVNSQNLGTDPQHYLAAFKRNQLCYMHLAGHSVLSDVRIDTHDEPVPDGVWELYRRAAQYFPDLPTMVEWDDHLPDFAGLVAELDKAKAMHTMATNGREVLPLRMTQGQDDGAAVRHAEQSPRHPERSEGPLAWVTLQDQFWSAITTLQDDAPPPPAGLLSDNQSVTAARGLSVYSDAYFLRLLGVLKDGFPALANVMGAARFTEAIRHYLSDHPPVEVSVKFVGQYLPAFMADYDSASFGVESRVLADLAALEWARHDLFDAADSPTPIEVGVLQELQPSDWESVRFQVINSAQLVPVMYDVGAVVDAVANGEPPARPEAQPGAYLVTRAHEDVAHNWLAPSAAAAFAALQQAASFGDAAAAAVAAKADGDDPNTVVHGVVAHLASWLNQDLICGISVPASTAGL